MFKFNKINTLIEELQKTKKNVRLLDMANSMGFTSKALENYRNGSNVPSVEKLEKIALYFGVDMNYFFDSMPSTSKEYSFVAEPIAPYGESGVDYKEKLISVQNELINKMNENSKLQQENAELQLELERIKNASAPVQDALAV